VRSSREAPAVKEAPVHARAVEQAHGSAVAVRAEWLPARTPRRGLEAEAMASRVPPRWSLETAFAPGAPRGAAGRASAGANIRAPGTGTLPHRKPRVTGWRGRRSLVPRPFSTATSREQQSGQSSAHTEWRVSGMPSIVSSGQGGTRSTFWARKHKLITRIGDSVHNSYGILGYLWQTRICEAI